MAETENVQAQEQVVDMNGWPCHEGDVVRFGTYEFKVCSIGSETRYGERHAVLRDEESDGYWAEECSHVDDPLDELRAYQDDKCGWTSVSCDEVRRIADAWQGERDRADVAKGLLTDSRDEWRKFAFNEARRADELQDMLGSEGGRQDGLILDVRRKACLAQPPMSQEDQAAWASQLVEEAYECGRADGAQSRLADSWSSRPAERGGTRDGCPTWPETDANGNSVMDGTLVNDCVMREPQEESFQDAVIRDLKDELSAKAGSLEMAKAENARVSAALASRERELDMADDEVQRQREVNDELRQEMMGRIEPPTFCENCKHDGTRRCPAWLAQQQIGGIATMLQCYRKGFCAWGEPKGDGEND